MLLIFTLFLSTTSNAFVIPQGSHRNTGSTLFGISEWRDNIFTDATSLTLKKPVCLLPFDYEEALVQGQTKELRLYEDRFRELFDDVVDNHEGVLAMALISEEDEGILSSSPLCEVKDYNRMGGELGIFLTIRCVGRVELMEVTQDGPYLKADCVEIMDQGTSDLAQGDVIADEIDNMVATLSRLEEELSTQLEAQARDGTLPEMIAIRNDDTDQFYGGDDDDAPTREERYEEAYKNALESDSQGYFSTNDSKGGRSAQELTAISWAAFSTEGADELDAPYRLQALDTDDLIERLKLGMFLLNEKQNLVHNILQESQRDSDEGFA